MSLSVRQKHNICIDTPGGCKDIIQGRCVQYSGTNIPTFNILAGDTLDLSLQKITQYILSAGIGGYSDAQAQAAIGRILDPTEFTFNPTAPYIGINQVAWSKITGAPAFLTSFTEEDPTVPAYVKAITAVQLNNWNQAYLWGDHAAAGYLKSYVETDPIFTAHVASSILSTQIQNWDTAYAKRITGLSVTGTTTKRVVATLADGTTLQSNLFSFAADTNNYPTSLTFAGGSLTLGREGLAPLVVSLDGRYLQSFTEQDPTVPVWVKNIPQGSSAGQFLNWNGSAWTANTVNWADIAGKPVLATQYTDEMAQDAIGNILVDSDSLYFIYDDAANILGATIIDQYVIDLISLHSPVITADNGLTKTGNNIQLGGDLLQNTVINYANNKLTFKGVIGDPLYDDYNYLELSTYAIKFSSYWSPDKNSYFEMSNSNFSYRTTQYGDQGGMEVSDSYSNIFVTGIGGNGYFSANRNNSYPEAQGAVRYNDTQRGFKIDTTGITMGYAGLHTNDTAFKGLFIGTDKNLTLHNYPNTRNDGSTLNALYVDASGNLKHGPVNLGNAGQNGGNFIWNTTTQQASSNFNISGGGAIAGKLGIGYTAIPTGYTLDVAGTGRFSTRLQIGSNSDFTATDGIQIGNDVHLSTASGQALYRAWGGHYFQTRTGGFTWAVISGQNGAINNAGMTVYGSAGTHSFRSYNELNATDRSKDLVITSKGQLRLAKYGQDHIYEYDNGSMFYRDDTNQFRGYRSGAWKNFLMEGDVAAVSAQNGLNTTNGPVELGGTLMRTTDIFTQAGGTTTNYDFKVNTFTTGGGYFQTVFATADNGFRIYSGTNGSQGKYGLRIGAFDYNGALNTALISSGNAGNNIMGVAYAGSGNGFWSYSTKQSDQFNAGKDIRGVYSVVEVTAENAGVTPTAWTAIMAGYFKATKAGAAAGTPYAIYSDGGINYFKDDVTIASTATYTRSGGGVIYSKFGGIQYYISNSGADITGTNVAFGLYGGFSGGIKYALYGNGAFSGPQAMNIGVLSSQVVNELSIRKVDVKKVAPTTIAEALSFAVTAYQIDSNTSGFKASQLMEGVSPDSGISWIQSGYYQSTQQVGTLVLNPVGGNVKVGNLNDNTGVAKMVTVTNGVLGYQAIPSGGTATTPAGSDTYVQYNNAGAFGASAGFTWNNSTKRQEITGDVYVHDARTVGSLGNQLDYTFADFTTTGLTGNGGGAVVAASIKRMDYNVTGGAWSMDYSSVQSANFNWLRLRSTAAATVSVTQSVGSARALSANAVQVHLIGNAYNSTISDVAGMQIYGVYPTGGTGMNITNYYGLLIANITEYSGAAAAITNKWAIYQAGAGDKSYFAGQVEVNQGLILTDTATGTRYSAKITNGIWALTAI